MKVSGLFLLQNDNAGFPLRNPVPVFITARALAFVLFLALLTAPAPADWKLQEDEIIGATAVRCVAELQCGPTRMVLAGTTIGVYLDPTGVAAPKRWIDVSEGLPGASLPGQDTELHTMQVRDSLIFGALKDGSVYHTLISIDNTPSCRPRPWLPYGANFNELSTVSDIFLADTLLYAATRDGVWQIAVQPDTLLSFENNAVLHSWERLGPELDDEILAVHKHRNNVVSGTFLNGAHYYDADCPVTTANCRWFESTSGPRFEGISVYAFESVSLAGVRIVNEFDDIPCQGVLVATGGDRNLYLAPVLTPDSIPAALDWYVDISPASFNPAWQYKINTILAGDFPNAPNSIFVGTEFGGVLWSGDCGQSWQPLNTGNQGKGLDGSDVRTLAIIRDSLLLAGANNGGFFHGGTFALASLASLMRQPTSVPAQTDSAEVTAAELRATTDINNEFGKAELDVPEQNLTIVNIAAYNLLGKKVLDIFQGELSETRQTFDFSIASLPNGIYLCIVQGRNLKLADKFVVSR